MHTSRAVLIACLALVVGCGKKRVAPPSQQTVTVAAKDATFHEWGTVKPCDVDPKTLAGDLDSTNALLEEFLAKTTLPTVDPAADAGTPEYNDDQINLIVDAAAKLPPLLDYTDKAVSGVAKCKFTKEDKVGDLSNKSVALLSAAGIKIAEAPAQQEKLRFKQAVKQWHDRVPESKDAAKKEWCPAKLKAGATPDIYYAFEGDIAPNAAAPTIEWDFCDDSKVLAVAGTPPWFEAPAAMKKKPKDKPYLDSAAKYPASDIQHPPRPGDKLPDIVDAGTVDGGTDVDAGMPGADAGT